MISYLRNEDGMMSLPQWVMLNWVVFCLPHSSTGTSNMSFEELLELQSQEGTKTYKQSVARNSTKKQGSRPPVQNVCVVDKHR